MVWTKRESYILQEIRRRTPQCDSKRRLWGAPRGKSVKAVSGTTERSTNRLMRRRREEMPGHDLARETGLGEQRDYRMVEMPMPVRPCFSAQPLSGSKTSRDGPVPSHSVDSPSAAPPSKKVRMNEVEMQMAETSETFEKRLKDWRELCAKFDYYKEKAKDRD